jgi:hypothetical protein
MCLKNILTEYSLICVLFYIDIEWKLFAAEPSAAISQGEMCLLHLKVNQSFMTYFEWKMIAAEGSAAILQGKNILLSLLEAKGNINAITFPHGK